MRALALTCEAIAHLDSVEAKVQCAAAHLLLRADDEVAAATRFLAGTPLPLGHAAPRVGRAAIAAAVAERCAIRATELRRGGRDLGDAVVAALHAAGFGEAPGLTLGEAAACLADLGKRAPRGREQLLRQLFTVVGPLEAKLLAELLTGELRIGMQAARVEDAVALAFRVPIGSVRRAHMLLSDIGEAARRAASGNVDEVRLRCFRPVRYMLARSVRDLDEALAGVAPQVLIEPGYDGLRAQVHVRNHKHRVFSRNLEDVTHLFPELGTVTEHLEGDWILDGEVIAYNGAPLPLDKLMQRLGRRQVPLTLLLDVPVVFRAFDVLRAAGRDLLEEPLERRKAALAALPASGAVAPVSYEIAAHGAAAGRVAGAGRDSGSVFLKDPKSLYTPGRRGGPWRRLSVTRR